MLWASIWINMVLNNLASMVKAMSPNSNTILKGASHN